ncbi:uncharacterized protein STEHIDRAFT_91862 [Stereum hirsutum FP-91666 SS1]|uniref:uncharacterized protein n=1 Tax=Stereum hirsutum (strain FP-91666) TaxID=721885 RepID=UPI000440FE17|nr:uncharacterized protein STEHIDRAFT_91862 [Stereum hirsutum FP-91666 SS1]EIM89478.1 hypothetical protein STEHIDRAFT_91862 [Stereum hirsutum FP-91666 SS1]
MLRFLIKTPCPRLKDICISQQLDKIEAQEKSLVFPSFTSDTAFALGMALRTRILALKSANPAIISISLGNTSPPPHCLPHTVFQAVTRPGITLNIASSIARNRNTVLRFERSSYYMSVRFRDVGGHQTTREKKISKWACLSDEESTLYSLDGGGVPIMVEGVEGIVGVVVVTGLNYHSDNHMVIVETIQDFLNEEKQQ